MHLTCILLPFPGSKADDVENEHKKMGQFDTHFKDTMMSKDNDLKTIWD